MPTTSCATPSAASRCHRKTSRCSTPTHAPARPSALVAMPSWRRRSTGECRCSSVEARDGQSGDNPWGIRLSTMFHMSNDSHLFHTREQLEGDGWRLSRNVFRRDNAEYLPLYEGRLGHQHNHRFASQPRGKMRTLTQTEMRDPNVFVEPQNWVLDAKLARHHPEREANIRLLRRTANCRTGLLGFRRVSSNTNERTCIATIIPWGATSYGWILSFGPDVHYLSLLCGIYNSFVFDFLLRCSLSQPSVPQSTFEQIPVQWSNPTSSHDHAHAEHSHRTIDEWILSRIAGTPPTPLGTLNPSQGIAAGTAHRSGGTTTAASCSDANSTPPSSTCICKPKTTAAGARSATPTVVPVTRHRNSLRRSRVAFPRLATLSPTSWTPSPSSAARTR